MGYGNKIFQAACQELERRKRQAEELADRGRERFTSSAPGAREIREEMAQNAAGAAKAVLSGGGCAGGNLPDEGPGPGAEGGVQPAAGGASPHRGGRERPSTSVWACRDTGFVTAACAPA